METLFTARTDSLQPVYEWGISVIRLFQAAAHPALTAFARFVTYLGEPALYILLLSALFWAVDQKKAFRLAVAVCLSNALNIKLKESLGVHRPFVHSPELQLTHAKGFSLPSGHAQNSAAFWPALLLDKTNPTGKPIHRGAITVSYTPALRIFRLLVALLLPTLIGLSRIYLGVHYPTDVLFGWGIGALISLTVIFGLPALQSFVVGRLPAALASSVNLPRSAKLALAAALAYLVNQLNGSDTSMGGALFGLAAGYILLTTAPRGKEDSFIPFSAAEGTCAQKLLRCLVGLAGVTLLYFGLKQLFPDTGDSAPLFRFMRYGLVGFWTTYAAPRLFQKLTLSK